MNCESLPLHPWKDDKIRISFLAILFWRRCFFALRKNYVETSKCIYPYGLSLGLWYCLGNTHDHRLIQCLLRKKVVSAYRSPEYMVAYAKEIRTKGSQVILVTAGGTAHLLGKIAKLTIFPVIGIPIQSKAFNGLDRYSSSCKWSCMISHINKA